MREKIEGETMRRGHRKRDKKRKKEGMRKEVIREVMVEEVRKVRTRERRMMGVSNVANQATMLLNATPRTHDPNHRRTLPTTKIRQNIILRDLCLLRKTISRPMNPRLMKKTTHLSVEWRALIPLIQIKRYPLLSA